MQGTAHVYLPPDYLTSAPILPKQLARLLTTYLETFVLPQRS